MASRLVVCLFVFFAQFFALGAARAEALAEPFTVRGVDVDVTARSANEAKELAIADGQRQAFQSLLDRLAAPKDRSRLPKADGADYVSDYAIQAERASAVRYIASLDVRFNPAAVRRLFKNANIPMVEPVVHPVVVIPVFSANGQQSVWDDASPWRAAWLSQGKGGLVAIVVPVAADGALPAPEQILAGSEADLLALGGRYHTSEVVSVLADLSGDGHKLEITATAVRGAPFDLPPVTITAKSGETPDQMMARAVRDMVQMMEKQVRQNVALAGTGAQEGLSVIVPLSGLDEWVSVRDRFSRGGVVRSWELVSLTRKEAAIVLFLGAEPDKARAALTNLGFDLQAGEGFWLLKSVRR